MTILIAALSPSHFSALGQHDALPKALMPLIQGRDGF